VSEPVVIKVRFDARTWIQADFVRFEEPIDGGDRTVVCVAVVGPVNLKCIEAVLYCSHGNRYHRQCQPVRTFADAKLIAGIKKMRNDASRFRADAWALSQMCLIRQDLHNRLAAGGALEVTAADELRRLNALKG